MMNVVKLGRIAIFVAVLALAGSIGLAPSPAAAKGGGPLHLYGHQDHDFY